MRNAFLAFRFLYANVAPTLPWKGSMKQARKIYGFALPFESIVTAVFVEVGLIWITFAAFAISETGMEALEQTSPMM